MSVLKRKRLIKIGIFFGILAFFMMFVIPFCINLNNNLYAGIFFSVFITCSCISNIAIEKSKKTVSLSQEREEKIRQVLGGNKKSLL